MKFEPPSERQLSELVDGEMNELRSKIVQMIGKRPFSISIDEATTKSMSMKVLGIVVHFVNVEAMAVQNAVLDLIQVDVNANAGNLRNLAINAVSSFGLDIGNVVKVVSDGAPVMKCAFM